MIYKVWVEFQEITGEFAGPRSWPAGRCHGWFWRDEGRSALQALLTGTVPLGELWVQPIHSGPFFALIPCRCFSVAKPNGEARALRKPVHSVLTAASWSTAGRGIHLEGQTGDIQPINKNGVVLIAVKLFLEETVWLEEVCFLQCFLFLTLRTENDKRLNFHNHLIVEQTWGTIASLIGNGDRGFLLPFNLSSFSIQPPFLQDPGPQVLGASVALISTCLICFLRLANLLCLGTYHSLRVLTFVGISFLKCNMFRLHNL